MKLNHKSFGSGEPLVILHGFLGMLDNWQAPARQLESAFHVLIVDLRNHGHSPHSTEHNYDLMVSDVEELLNDLSIERAHLLGHSMGGKVAMCFAQKHPNRVDKLIVADIAPKYYRVHHQSILAGLRAVPLDKIEKRTDADDYMSAHIPEVGVRQFLMKSLYHPNRHSFAWRFNLDALEANIENIGQATDALEYEGETLFIRGSKSNYIEDQDWADIKVVFPNAYLETIEDAGHWVHAEQPVAFVEAVLGFLK